MKNEKIRNIAIIAHVDHGKTTLVDGLLWQSGLYRENQHVAERAMDSIDIERERGITLTAKNASILYGGVRINLVDTPGHADFGGEVERGLKMVDGALLLVDAAEGPFPQTRFVLKHALQQDLEIIVVINKIDRSDARPAEVLEEIYQLFFDLEAKDHQIEFPVLYTDARKRIALLSPDEDQEGKNLKPLFDAILEKVPGPTVGEGGLAMLTANVSYSEYVGRLGVGRIRSGSLKVGDTVMHCAANDKRGKAKVTALFSYSGMETVKVESAEAGEIVIVAGVEDLQIGDTLTDPANPQVLPRIEVEQPTISIELLVNSGPFAGKDGNRLTSRVIWERIERELRTNVSLKSRPGETADAMILQGRGELQFAVLAEQMRREGYEFMLGRPKVITKETENGKEEPLEHVVMDIPDTYVGVVTEKLGGRRGEMTHMEKIGADRVRVEFDIVSRGLIGYRAEFLNDTRGTGIMSSYLSGYVPWRGHVVDRINGALIADRRGTATPYALFNLEDRGRLLIKPGVDVYEGMIVGENTRPNDMNVNVCREKKLTNMRASGTDENVILVPVAPMTLEFGITWLADDEVLEVTPHSLRLRKRILAQTQRSLIRTAPDKDEK